MRRRGTLWDDELVLFTGAAFLKDVVWGSELREGRTLEFAFAGVLDVAVLD